MARGSIMDGMEERSQITNLNLLVAGLNALRAKQHPNPKERMIWENIERIIMAVVPERVPRQGRSILSSWMAEAKNPSLEEAQRRFHWLARNYPVQLTIALNQTRKGLQVVPGFRCHESKPEAWLEVGHLDLLWHFLAQRGYERLGTCRKCGNWFVNYGRNKTKVSCGEQCASRFWTRSQRRKSAEKQSSEKRQEREHRREQRRERAQKLNAIDRKIAAYHRRERRFGRPP